MSKRNPGPDSRFQNLFQISTDPGEVLSILNEKVLANKKWANRVPETGHLEWAQIRSVHEYCAAMFEAKMAGANLSQQLHAGDKPGVRFVEADGYGCLEVSAAKGEEWRLAADTLKHEARAIAESWINCGKQIDAPGADELYKRTEEFLKSNPQRILPHPLIGLPLLCYSHKKTQNVREEIDWQIGWLCLCLAVSTWSQDLRQCPRCKDFYVRKRATQGANPGCCHECRRPLAESENTAKKRDDALKEKVKCARTVIAKLAKLSPAKRPPKWEPYVADDVSRRLKLKTPITRWSITRWLAEGTIKEPW